MTYNQRVTGAFARGLFRRFGVRRSLTWGPIYTSSACVATINVQRIRG